MIAIRKAADRGHFNFGWLDTFHTFSFGDYHDPAHMGFRSLRVINEDRVGPGQGFGTHPHRDMEIITYVLEGGLAHRDSLGHEEVVRPGDVQRMTAGSGIEHSEFNGSKTDPIHLLQIWLRPAQRGLKPGYEQKHFPLPDRQGKLALLVSPDGADGSLSMNQDARLYAAVLAPGQRVNHPIGANRHAWVQVARGEVNLNGQKLSAGDGAAVSEESALAIEAKQPSEVVVFDLA